MAKVSKQITKEDNTPSTFDLIPNGWYEVEVNSAELRDNKNTQGNHHAFVLTILGPTRAGAKLFPTFTDQNDNEKAVEIGRRQLARFAGACGVDTLDDTEQMIGRRCMARVGVQKASDPRYEDRNEVKDYKPVGAVLAAGKVNPPRPVSSPGATPTWGEAANAAPNS